MRKFLAALIIVMAMTSPAQALTDFCWPSYAQTAWTAMKNAGHWYWNKIVDSRHSFQGPTISEAYYDKMVPNQTSADWAYNWLIRFCGPEPYKVIVDTGTDTLTDLYTNFSKDNPIATNDQIKFYAGEYPTGINSSTTYYVVNAARNYGTALNISSVFKQRSDIPNIRITTTSPHGLYTNDEIYVQNVGGMTQINNRRFVVDVFDANTVELRAESSEWPGDNYGAYTSGGTIKKITDTFQISLTQGGSPIDLTDIGSGVGWYPASQPLNWGNSCGDMYRGYTTQFGITSLTNASQGVITTDRAHGYANGETVYIDINSGGNRYRDNYQVSDATAYTFKFKSSGSYVDTTSWGSFSDGNTRSEAVPYGDSNDIRGYFPWAVVTFTHFSQSGRWTNSQTDMIYTIIDAQWDKSFRQVAGYPPNGDTDSLYAFYWNTALWATVNNWLAGGPTSPSAGKYLDKYNEIMGYRYGVGGGYLPNIRGFGGFPFTDTAAGRGTLRGIIHKYALNSAGGNINTGSDYGQEIGPYFQYMKWLKDYWGTDHYTDFTDNANNMFLGMIHAMTPDKSDMLHWGDTQNTGGIFQEMFKLRPFLSGSVLSTCNWMLGNVLFGSGQSGRHPGETFMTPFPEIDPYGSPSSFGLSGHTAFNSESLPAPTESGWAYYHTGWTDSDSFYGSMALGNNMGDHDPDSMSNMGLYRNGEWIIREVREYNQYSNMNTVDLWGGVRCILGCEVRGQISYEANTTNHWMLHQGVIGGRISLGVGGAEPDNSPLKEFTDTHFAMRNADGSDTVIFFRRIDALDIRNASNLTAFQNYSGYNLTPNAGKHTMKFWGIPSGSLTRTGDKITWSSGGGTVSLFNFIPGGFSYDALSITANNVTSYGVALHATNTTDGMHFYKNILHVGSTPTITEISASSGESADGVLIAVGSENKAVIGNATQGTAPTEYTRAALRNKSYFKTGATFTIPTTAATELHIIDIDPTRVWSATIDGATTNPITVSSAGVFSATVSSYGSNHTVTLTSQSSCNGSDWRACTISNCATNGWFWYNNTCNQTALCDAQHLTGCNSSTCTGVGYWYNNVCNATPAPTCDSSHCSLCTTSQGQCEGVGCNWWEDSTCHTTAAPTCDDDCSLCADATECGNSQYPCFWWSSTCNTTSQPSYEDLTSWNIYDPGQYQTVTFAQASTLGSQMPGNAISYLNKDSGTDYWTTFNHQFDIRSSNYNGYQSVNLVPWSVSNSSAATYSGLASGQNGIGLLFNPWTNIVTLKNFITGESDNDAGSTWIWNNWRYYTVERTDTTITCKIYSSADRGSGDLLDTLTIPYDATAFRYTTVSASDGSADPGSFEMASVANVDIGQSSGPIDPPAPEGPSSIFGGCSLGGGQF